MVVREAQVADRVRVDAPRSGLMSLARFAFQACSFNHSDISAFKWNHSLQPLHNGAERRCAVIVK
jgi:hypothetical protein